MSSVAVAAPDTAGRILDIAEHLVQTRGFNGFSYADIAAELHVTKASLHYHFPSKASLVERLVERYREGFLTALDGIDQKHDDARAKLKAYVGIYASVLDNGRMCLCGMLAADYATLQDSIRERLRLFFDSNEAWLTTTLRRGRQAGQIAFSGNPADRARFIVGALEGGMLLARSNEDGRRFRSIADRLLADLRVSG